MRMLLILMLLVPFAAGCKKKGSAVASAALAPTPGGAADTNYQAGGGAIQGSRRAAQRIKVDAELQQLGQFMELQFNELGRMPSVNEIKQNLSTAQNILKHITEGSIVLTGTRNHAGVWAYQVDADTLGGLALVAGTPNKYSAEDLQNLLKGN